jgi:hypothetical protein
MTISYHILQFGPPLSLESCFSVGTCYQASNIKHHVISLPIAVMHSLLFGPDGRVLFSSGILYFIIYFSTGLIYDGLMFCENGISTLYLSSGILTISSDS